MRIRRSFWLLASLILCLSLSCGQRGQDIPAADSMPPKTAPAAEPRGDSRGATAPQLPPETAAIASSVAGGLVNPPKGDLRLAVISDLNGAYGSTDYDPEVDKAIALMPLWDPDIVLCSGDMVAGQSPTLTVEEIRAMWAAFDAHVAAPLRQAQLPYGFTVGNHDASSARGQGGSFLFAQERDLAAEYWNDPAHDPGLQFSDRHQFPFFYSFTFEDVFFLAWDGSSSSLSDEELAWVEQALASPEAQNAKLRILLGHLPLYAVAIGRDSPGEVMENADVLRALLEQYNVHTYISGHQHAYYPARRGDLQLLHTGLLGSGPRPLIAGNLPPGKTLTIIDITFDVPQALYTTYDMETLGLIELQQLPRYLVGHNGMVLRRDVAWKDLEDWEQADCLQQHGEACGP